MATPPEAAAFITNDIREEKMKLTKDIQLWLASLSVALSYAGRVRARLSCFRSRLFPAQLGAARLGLRRDFLSSELERGGRWS